MPSTFFQRIAPQCQLVMEPRAFNRNGHGLLGVPMNSQPTAIHLLHCAAIAGNWAFVRKINLPMWRQFLHGKP